MKTDSIGNHSYVFFWHENEENGLFSNWYPSPFVIDSFCYQDMEQYIMAEKAKLFKDAEMYTAILRSNSPQQSKALGRKVSGFDNAVWAPERHRILVTGLREKFGQNPVLKEQLLQTKGAILAEASPKDTIFGIGLDRKQALQSAPSQWPGENLLGKALMEVRKEFLPAEVPADRLEEAQKLANQLLNSLKYSFSDLKPSMLPDGTAGVYVITNRHTGEVLYVGRTKNLRQRLYYNHLMGPTTNARLKKHLIEDASEPAVTTPEEAKAYIKEHCYAQFLTEADVLRRGQLEGLLSFMLNVKYMHEEH